MRAMAGPYAFDNGTSVRSYYFIATALALVVMGVSQTMLSANCYISKTNVFRQVWQTDLKECLGLCKRRNRCAGVRYHSGSRHCSLLHTWPDSPYLNNNKEEPPVCTYVDISTWTSTELGPCNSHNCADTEECNWTTENPLGFVCKPTECPSTTDVTEAHLMSLDTEIGIENRYKCSADYSGVGNAKTACFANATWSLTDFSCLKQCVRPNMEYERAVLERIDVKNNFALGTTVHFKCKNGYYSADLKGTRLVCDDKGKWSDYSLIGCCPHGERFVGRFCTKLYQGQLFSTTNDIKTFCEGVQRWWMALWPTVANKFLLFEPNINLLILNMEKQAIANKYSLEPCMSASGIEGATALSYDQMVRFARDHSMLGNEKCSSVLYWADGQPDGGDLEECVYLNRSESGEYLWHDVRCDFGQDFRPAFVCGWQVTDIIE